MKRKDGEPTVDETETLIYGSEVRFDYSAIERTLDQARAPVTPEMAAARPTPTDQVQKRRTIDEQSIPKDDAVYDIRQLGNYQVVTVRGQLNESFPGRTIGTQLHGPALFDLTEVDRVTSFGVRSWLEMLDSARLPFAAFVRASPAVVNQITMMRNFCGTAKIHSLIAPYACPRCGSGFGVPFEAIEDRTILRSRKPPKVVCPECNGPAEMDEDPWVYFDLDDHLLDTIDLELQQVLVHVGDGPRRPPVEKSIVGNVTRVRINGPLSSATRLQRAFSGLEGDCVLDLRTVTEVDYSGVDNLLQRLVKLPDEVVRLVVEGAPLALVQRLLENPVPRVYVNSVVTTVRSLSRPLWRRLCVDLKRNRAALKAQQVPDVDLPWRDDPMQLEGRELVAEALRLLPNEGVTTPAPLQKPAPSAVQAQPVVAAAPPPPRTRAPNRAWWTSVAAVASVVFVMVFVATVWLVLTAGRDWARIASDPLVVPVDGWSTQGGLPPPWAELQFAQANGTILLVGHGSGATADEALASARQEASDTVLELLSRELRLPFEDEALPLEGPEREEAVLHWREASSALMLTRVQDAARRTDDGVEVVAQYAVSREELEAMGARYTQEASFRGLTVVPRAPWSPAGLRLVRRESYLRSVEPGDVLRSIGTTPVTTLDNFQAVAQQAYHWLEEGDSLPFLFDRKGEVVITTVMKPKTFKEPDPVLVNRPTLFRRENQ